MGRGGGNLHMQSQDGPIGKSFDLTHKKQRRRARPLTLARLRHFSITAPSDGKTGCCLFLLAPTTHGASSKPPPDKGLAAAELENDGRLPSGSRRLATDNAMEAALQGTPQPH